VDDGLPDEAAPARRGRRAKAGAAPAAEPLSGDADLGLFAALKALRKRLADERGVPAYVVFTDATLAGMCRARPRTPEQLLQVSGVGQHKLETYGATFLQAIADFEGGGAAG
jgi:ATP-dependent DNA helicase RecQ